MTKKNDLVKAHFLKWHITDPGRPPYVMANSVKVDLTNFGDAFIAYVEVPENATMRLCQDHYPKALVDNLTIPGRLDELNRVLGLEPGYCETYNCFLDVDPGDTEKIRELCRLRCEDCFGLIEERPDIQWRFSLHRIRCDRCAGELIDRGENHFDAYYVM